MIDAQGSIATDLTATRARGQTSLYVRRIISQPDEASWLWLVQRLNPLLELQAEYRLRGAARSLCDPQDLLNEAWLVTFMRLHQLRPRDGRWTPVLLEFLSTTLLHKINDLLRKELRRRIPRGTLLGAVGTREDAPMDRPPSEWSDRLTSALSAAARSEVGDLLRAALARLSPAEREIVVLRGIEQRSNEEVAALLGLGTSAASMRWIRALARLRRSLPAHVVEDLARS